MDLLMQFDNCFILLLSNYRDEARRKLLAEKRKAMKNQLQDAQEPMATPEPEAEIQIFAPETPHTG